MKRKPKIAWIENATMGELVPPELDLLIKRLSLINSDDTRLVVEHARKIYTAYQLWRWRVDSDGLRITGKKRLHVKRTPAARGLKDDLLRLFKTAAGGSAKEWKAAWFGVSGRARQVVSPPAPPIVDRQFDEKGKLVGFRRASLSSRGMKMVNAGSLRAVVPSPEQTMPRIEAALAKGDFSSKRVPDKVTYAFVLRVRDAYFALTGRKGLSYRDMNDNSTLDPKGGFAHAGLVELATHINRQFDITVLSISRLRKKETDMGFTAEELKNLRKPWGMRTS